MSQLTAAGRLAPLGRDTRILWPAATVLAATALGIVTASAPTAAVTTTLGVLTTVAVTVAFRRHDTPVGLGLFGGAAALLYVIPSTLAYFYGASGGPFRVLGVGLLLATLVWLAWDATAFAQLGRWRVEGHGRTAVWVLALLAVTGASVGLLRNNHPSLIWSDALRLGVSALGLVIGAALDRQRMTQLVYTVGAVLLAIDTLLLVAYVSNLVSGSYDRMGGASAGAIAFGLMLVASAGDRQRRVGMLVLLVEFAIMALSLTRGLWLAVVVVMLVGMIVYGRRARHAMLAVCIATVALVVLSPIRESASSTAVEQRVTATLQQGADEDSIAHRFVEARAAWETLGEIPGGLAVGAGLGATYDDVVGVDNHHIHITVMSVLFRHGFVGAALYGFAYIYCAALALRAPVTRDRAPVTIWASALILMTSVLSISSYVLIGELLPAVAIGWLLRIVTEAQHDGAWVHG